jgi:ABC-type xylose transport system permease subunit
MLAIRMKQYLKNYFLCVIFAIAFFSILGALKWVTPRFFYVPANIITILSVLLFPGITRFFLDKAREAGKKSDFKKAMMYRFISYVFIVPPILYFTILLISNWGF